MASLTATDVTVTVSQKWINGKKKHTIGTMTIAGTNTYPTGGIPLPAVTAFGMYRALDILTVIGAGGTATGAGNTTEYVYRHNAVAKKLQLYNQASGTSTTAAQTTIALPEVDTSEAPGSRVVDFWAIGW